MEMEIGTQLNDVPVELIHHIQSFLPAKEAARSCVLSKSWLRSWLTIPTLRFPLQRVLLEETNYGEMIDRTLVRYEHDNIPIECFDLQLYFNNKESASLTEKWIRIASSKSSLKEISFGICSIGMIDKSTLPVVKFTHENLNTINVEAALWIRRINCVSLWVLKLEDVNIYDKVLDNVLATCCLLEKIYLLRCNGFRTIKVKNLLRLRELELNLIKEKNVLEIDNVPRLDLLHYTSHYQRTRPFSTESLGNVTQLHIDGLIIDNAFLDIIKSNFPFLQSLILVVNFFSLGLEESSCLVITSVSLKTLTLKLWKNQIEVQVYAPQLQSFFFHGFERPSLSVPIIVPHKIIINT